MKIVTNLFRTIQNVQKNKVDTLSEEISAKLKEGFFAKKKTEKKGGKFDKKKKKGFLENRI